MWDKRLLDERCDYRALADTLCFARATIPGQLSSARRARKKLELTVTNQENADIPPHGLQE